MGRLKSKPLKFIFVLFDTNSIRHKFCLMGSVTQRSVIRLLAIAKVNIFSFGGYVLDGSILRKLFDKMGCPKTFMSSVAKWLKKFEEYHIE
jgi:hypothetical protein